MIIDGKKISENLINSLKNKPTPKKFLAAILVGKDHSSISFLKQKEKTAKVLGIDFRLYNFDENIKNDELRGEVLKISQHKTCGGVLVQLPLPSHINKHYILNVIPREKDIDVLGERSLGAFYTGRNLVLPPAVATVAEIIKALNLELQTFKVAVVGLGFLVGKPISTWLEGKAKEIILFDEGSDFLLLREADLIITGVGGGGIVKPDMLKDEAIIIDFGYKNGIGDFDSSLLINNQNLQSISYTPTPGGTGPILVAKLLENFYVLSATQSPRD